jgi:simple sugar transport system ATP-binding protein
VGIEKRFGATRAVRRASLVVDAGVLHAIVGENGAGKSTLLKIAAGIVARDAGEVWTFGDSPAPYDARIAQARGVGMVQQHFALFGDLTVLENMILGAEPTHAAGRLDRVRAAEGATRVLRELGVTLPLEAKVSTLGVADKQRLEIARTLYRDARVVILDEPTAVLTPHEATTLYKALRRLADEGRAVVVVTHKLDEVLTHADVVTVMRRGETLGTRPVARGADVARLAGELVGGEPLPPVQALVTPLGETRLTVRELARGPALHGTSLEVHAGEIVGIAGVSGNGQSELVGILGGLLEPDAGEVVAGSMEVVHEDRQTEGLVLSATVRENLVLGELGQLTAGSWLGVIDERRVTDAAASRIARFDIRPTDPEATARSLSGGNQQKVVVARALARAPDVLVIAHPTRGVDPIAARAIHEQLLGAAARGTALLVIGADLTELRLLCRRILVMVRGRVVASFPPTVDDEALGAAMLGGEA